MRSMMARAFCAFSSAGLAVAGGAAVCAALSIENVRMRARSFIFRVLDAGESCWSENIRSALRAKKKGDRFRPPWYWPRGLEGAHVFCLEPLRTLDDAEL